MNTPSAPTTKYDAWAGMRRGQKRRPVEWIIEKFIHMVALSAIVMVFLIFLFVAREALPIILGRATSAAATEVIPVADFDKTSPAKLQKYLGLTPEQFRDMDRESKLELMSLKVETASRFRAIGTPR